MRVKKAERALQLFQNGNKKVRKIKKINNKVSSRPPSNGRG